MDPEVAGADADGVSPRGRPPRPAGRARSPRSPTATPRRTAAAGSPCPPPRHPAASAELPDARSSHPSMTGLGTATRSRADCPIRPIGTPGSQLDEHRLLIARPPTDARSSSPVNEGVGKRRVRRRPSVQLELHAPDWTIAGPDRPRTEGRAIVSPLNEGVPDGGAFAAAPSVQMELAPTAPHRPARDRLTPL
jgi:hypothetical protein